MLVAKSTVASGQRIKLPQLALIDLEREALMRKLLSEISLPLREDVERVLLSSTRGPGYTNLRRARISTRLMVVHSVKDAETVCRAAGINVQGVMSLAQKSAIDAITAMAERGEWSGQTVGIVLGRIRSVCRAIFGKTPPDLRTSACKYQSSPRKRFRRQLSEECYLEGAMMISCIADFAEASGQILRAGALRSDAALLGAAAVLHGRRGEYIASDLQMVRRSYGNKPSISFYWDASWRKNAKTRIAKIQDQRALYLLNRGIDDRIEGQVFCMHGKGMAGYQIYRSIRRSALLACGVRATPNSLRDAGTLRSTDAIEMGRQIGSSGAVSVEHYRPSMAAHGLSLLETAFTTAARYDDRSSAE